MKIRYLSLMFFIVLFSFAAKAQVPDSCVYTLELFDSFGDGWNGAAVVIIANEDTTSYTLNDTDDNGFFRAFQAKFADGDTVSFYFQSGSFDGEVGFAIYNPERIRLFAAGPNPIPNVLISAVIECPSCFVSMPTSVRAVDVRAFTAALAWSPPVDSSAPDYLIEYGVTGFTPGTGSFASTADTSITLRNLAEMTSYQFYLSSVCSTSDSSRRVGPFEFKTLWANDVGIVEVSTPNTQCGLGASEAVTVTLRNFGGQPQSLIPFKYSVNGVDAGVPIPVDGFFTGVLGKDSTFTVEFETTFDFSTPGVYTIQAWTELETESDVMNDTTTITFISIPTIDILPYDMDFEEWSGGWTVASDSRNPSWAFGVPSGNVITSAASGQNAWVTNLSGEYNLLETSYLVSPCLDFSALQADPRITFSLFVDTEAPYDEGWLELTVDDGKNWTKVGSAGTGINWYNDAENDYWNGDGGFDGWVTASNILAGTAGQANVRLRFVFSSDFSETEEGMGIDDIFISTPLARDLAALTATNDNTDECGTIDDLITLTISNFGSATVSGFDVSYQANGGTIVTENVGMLSIPPGEQTDYTFSTPLNTTEAVVYTVKTWTSAPGELFPANDTTTFSFNTAATIPFAENFEGGALPEGWTVDNLTNVVSANSHGNTSFVIADNLSSLDRNMQVITPAIGYVEMGDSLVFDYRIVDFTGAGSNATQLGAGDSIIVEISLDCGATYTTIQSINSNNHTPSTELQKVVIHLDDYVGAIVKFRLRAFWNSGDYWIDFDNFNIIRCPNSLGLTTEVLNETVNGQSDGQATVNAGTGFAPFTYEWSNGSTNKTAVRLSPGVYNVTVTDRFGCTDNTSVQIGTTTDIDEPRLISRVSLSPNPTSNETLLRVELAQSTDLYIQVFNLSGQLIFQTQHENVTTLNLPINLNDQPTGMYILRLLAKDQLYTEKLVKTN